jgi:glutaredoxin
LHDERRVLELRAKLFFATCCFVLLLSPATGWSGATFAAAEISPYAAVPLQESAPETVVRPPDIEVFVREGCAHCARAKKFLEVLQREQPQLRMVIRDVSREPAAMERLQRIAASQRTGNVRVPAFVVGGQLIVGFYDAASTGQLIRDSLAGAQHHQAAASTSCGTEANLDCIANESLSEHKPETYSVDFFGRRVSLEQIGLPLFTLALGLLDGFNPCSMWVLILMISLLAPLNNRPRMLAIAGAFVAVEGLAYFIFMAAWLNLFLLIGLSRVSEIIIATLALVAGAIHLKDFWAYGWGISLSIPATAKPGIYARMRRILQAENLGAALLGTVVLAILVQIVEFMCTSGFPALFTRILTLQQLDSISYYGYLLLYDLAYMFDDVIILAIGVITLSQHRLQENEGRWLKLVSGLVMVGLGVYLLLQ